MESRLKYWSFYEVWISWQVSHFILHEHIVWFICFVFFNIVRNEQPFIWSRQKKSDFHFRSQCNRCETVCIWSKTFGCVNIYQNHRCVYVCELPLSSSIRAGMMPDLANMAAQASSMETVPIIITTSRMRSSSAEPETHTHPKTIKDTNHTRWNFIKCWWSRL